MEGAASKRAQSLREQIIWYLNRIEDEGMLSKILTFINRLFVGGRV